MSDLSMKILHVISSGGMYGAEAVILNLSRTLRDRGHESALAVFANSAQPNDQLERRARAEGLETHAIPCRGQLDLAVPSRLRELVRTARVDVVHAHGYKADIYAAWALHGSKTPFVSTCHNWLDNNLLLRIYGKLDRLALRKFQRVIAVSEGVQQRLLSSGVRADKVMLISNGIDLRPLTVVERSPSQTRPYTVGIVARLSAEKGVDLFLQAAAAIHESLPETQFVVAGDGPDRAALQKLIEELHLNDHARLVGRQENMPAFYASMDVLVLSSRTEGLPMALLEGMGSGLPVVATSVGEIPLVIENGQTGLLVPPEDPRSLAKAVIALLGDSELRYSMGERARARVDREFSAERMTEAYLRVYETVLRENHS